MKAKHWIFLGLAIVGILVILHITMSHGGVSGFKQAVGLGG